MIKRKDEECEASLQNTKKKKKHPGKVIRSFIIEIVDIRSDPDMNVNPSNPYTQMSEEERYKDFIEIFSLLWAESCRGASQKAVEKQAVEKKCF